MNVLLSAGEVSSDIVGASIAAELLRREPSAHLWGLGGSRMQASGVAICAHTNELGRVGVSESFSAILPFLRAFAGIRREVRRSRPDVAILLANDVFNAVLGRWLRARGIPTLAFFPPQVWIWRSLLRVFCRSYDVVAASFPEEARQYARHARTAFVGHPLANTLARASDADRVQARAELSLEGHEVVGLLPGSRLHEIAELAPLLLEAAALLVRQRPRVQFVMAVAEASQESALVAEIARRDLSRRVIVIRDSHLAMRASDLLLMASGTATLEASLIGTPMIAVYRVFPLTMFIVRMAIRLGLMDSEVIALPNRLAGEMLVPEIRQELLDAERVVAMASELLDDAVRRASMARNLARIRDLVAGDGTIARVVDLALSLLPAQAAAPRRSVPPMAFEGGPV